MTGPIGNLPPQVAEQLRKLAADIAEVYEKTPEEVGEILRESLDNGLRELPRMADGFREAGRILNASSHGDHVLVANRFCGCVVIICPHEPDLIYLRNGDCQVDHHKSPPQPLNTRPHDGNTL